MSGMHRDRVETKDRPGLHERFRLLIQLASAALVNGYAAGFAGCKIFTGTSKMVCLPVLNCYSCPGALGACPIGSLQAVEGGAKHNISFYVLGTLMLFGVLFGRLICGFLCPFGLVQDLLGRIPARKLHVPEKIGKPVRHSASLFLQVHLPGRNAGGRNSAPSDERKSAQNGRSFVELEAGYPDSGDPWICVCPKVLLQIPVPARFLLFVVQPVQSVSDGSGQIKMCRLQKL